MSTIRRPVVITGASSGIGWAAALHLDSLGFEVFAGVRRDDDGDALRDRASEHLTPVRLDVTDDESIAAAARTVSETTGGELFGLVNNAGISLNGPLELVPIPDVKRLMGVNVIGALAVTKAFLPMLRRRRGRIVNISSGHGLLAVPDKSAYAASKFALEAISDSLRVELRPFDIQVCCVVVGKVDTAVLDKIVADREAMIRAAGPELVELYAPLLEFFDREVKGLPGIPAARVGEVVAEALMTAKSKPRYLIGPGAKKMKNLARLPVGLRDRLLFNAIYGRRRA